ncbi:heat shock factor protein isoform X2 [Ischnura elegans]|uniref:heat shock factor protein isoform X2 n=1 Tax=Ischnura elegans TaxID=197161 RepID=UPI001ED8A33F|nr:heat shock factor protein isoform X2 [Ischnura elegans]
MHSISEVGSNVPAFLAKLWKLVEDPTTNSLIAWSSEGSSFLIRNQAQFSRELLPLYYKHNNLASFIRQLNMYGFRKISSVDSGGLKLDKDEMEFAHKYFLRGHPYLLDNIKRKIPTGAVHGSGSVSGGTNGSVKPEIASRVLLDVKQMKGRQESLDSRFNALKRENEALWRELALLRQKHMKQQQIVNKLIQFLVTLVQPNRGLGIKRTYPLMLNDSPNVLSNRRRGPTQPKTAKLNLISDVMTSEELSPNGPVIHELDNTVEYILPDDNYEDLGGVEFDCGKDASVDNGKISVAAGLSCDKLKNNVGYSESEPEVGAEVGDVPIELAKELDRVVPLVNSPSSSLGNLESLPSSPANTMDVPPGSLAEDILASDPDLQSDVPENCLLPSVEYPLSPEMFMGSVDPAVVSPAPPSKMSKAKGQSANRSSRNSSKSSSSVVKRSPHVQSTRKTRRGTTSLKSNSNVEDLDVYPEIHLEEGCASVSDEEANLLRSLTTSGEVNVNDLNINVETTAVPENKKNEEKDDSNMALACTSASSGENSTSENSIREELDMHIDATQSELDLLKEMLMKGTSGGGPGNEGDILGAGGGLEGYCLDASALLGLFSSDDPFPIGLNSMPGSSEGFGNNTKENPDFSVSGNEIAAYNPTLLDLVEDDDDDSQILNWYDEASAMSTPSDDVPAPTSGSSSRSKSFASVNVSGTKGKGSGKVVTSVIAPKNANPSRRKTK